MNSFNILNKKFNIITQKQNSRCYQYATSELCRLLGRIGVETQINSVPIDKKGFSITIMPESCTPPETFLLPGDDTFPDAYTFSVEETHLTIGSQTAKGILNGVYDFAERIGFRFILPGESGEWVPTDENIQSLRFGEETVNPQFRRRGVFFQSLSDDKIIYSTDEWLRFYAKLRFNAIRHEPEDAPLAEELGLRLEVGGHGLSHLLPRDMFEKNPEMFRMFQPEDFNGRRMNDANLCVTDSKGRQIVKDNFKKELMKNKDTYAIHAWADDLPAGGWCLCPSCRAFNPSDQAMIGTRILSEAIREESVSVKVPFLAYHDTMYPGAQISPPEESFLLFAPRERCYGHALDDPECQRNRFYMEALRQWMKKFEGIEDAHTFEYYFDQVLFRGFYPFIPSVILRDLQVYKEAGIESHLSLQVAGPAIAPEYNMLIFSRANWESELTSDRFIDWLTKGISPEDSAPWQEYLRRRAEIYTDALRFCDHDVDIYLDYRWLPESVSSFAKEIAETYKKASENLKRITDDLAAAATNMSECNRLLVEKEIKRGYFESAELMVMHFQQHAMNHFAEFLNSSDKETAEKGISLLEQAIDALRTAREKAEATDLPSISWYFGNINKWLTKEFTEKIKKYRELIDEQQ